MSRSTAVAPRPSTSQARPPTARPASKSLRASALRVVADPPPAFSANRGALPSTQAPQLASTAERAPAGAEWLSEIKLDGYRLLVWLDHDRVRLITRNGHDWTARLPRLAARFAALDVETALVDGEMVALRDDGSSHFHDLQAALSAGDDARLFFFAFDLLHLNGWDLRPCALTERKRLLEAAHGWGGHLRYADHVAGNAAGLHREATRLGLEGIICKRADAPYRAGRGDDWLKVKCVGREEFVILGWTPPAGSRQGLGALALGYHDGAGRLHYAGLAGSGFSNRDAAVLQTRLAALPPAPPTKRPTRLLLAGEVPDPHIRWVAPELVAEISFTAWSGDGRLRHPVFLGLREDKAAADVVMPVADIDATRSEFVPGTVPTARPAQSRKRWKGAVPPLRAGTG